MECSKIILSVTICKCRGVNYGKYMLGHSVCNMFIKNKYQNDMLGWVCVQHALRFLRFLFLRINFCESIIAKIRFG